jgi:DNA-binding XRE family transcriptional regulator
MESTGTIDIPVMLDDLKEKGISRFTYFSIEYDRPAVGWELGMDIARIPVFLIGLSAIVWRPVGQESYKFITPDMIEDIFVQAEHHDGLFIDVNEIWFPNLLLSQFTNNRGDVFRVKQGLFSLAYSFQAGELVLDELLRSADHFSGDIYFSEAETNAYKQWSARQIEIAKETYPKNRGLEIKWIEES